MKIKKYIVGLIAFLGLFSFTNATDYNSQFNIISKCGMRTYNTITWNGNFTTEYNGNTKENILYFIGDNYRECNGKQYFVFGRKNGQLYGFINIRGNKHQGYFNYYGLCSDPTSNCNLNMLFTGAINGFLKSNDIIGFYASNDNQGSLTWVDGPSTYNYKFCLITDNNNTPYVCFYNNNATTSNGFSTSLDFNVSDRNDLNSWNGFFNNSPIYSNSTINEYSCPTIQQLINTYGEEYNTNLCYSSNIIDSGGTATTVTPKTIFELYNTYTGLNEDITNYNIFCNRESTRNICQSIFENKQEQYTLIAKIPNNVEPTKLYQYCNLSLNYQPNQTTCTLSGGMIGLYTGVSINDIISEIGKLDYTVITPGRPPKSTGTGNGSGSVYDTLLGGQEDNTQRWNVIENARNIIKTMKELYTKFTGIFRGRQGTQGIIPFYITGLMLLIVLFKLWKK